MKKIILIILFVSVVTPIFSGPIPFAQEDRDRIFRLEEGQKSKQKQLDDIKSSIFWGFGIVFSMICIMIGFVLWDRRSAISPVTNKTRELEKEVQTLRDILKEYGPKNPKLLEIIKQHHIL